MANAYTYTYTDLTVSLTREQATPVVSMVQGDTGRGLRITLTDDVYVDEAGSVDSSLTAKLWAKKPSGKEVSMDASQVIRYENSNSYQIIFDGSDVFANAIAEVGTTQVQVILLSGETYITSFSILFNVQGNLMKASSFTSSTEYADAITLLNALNQQKSLMDQYISQFQNQLKLTVNVRYGTGDPSYQSGDKDGDLYIRIRG